MGAPVDIAGQRFGRLVAELSLGIRNGKSAWSCVCDCGALVETTANSLRTGHVSSCGCGRRGRLDAGEVLSKLRANTVVNEFGCWLWTGAVNGGGYSAMRRVGVHGGHRVSYVAFVGAIPSGLQVCHKCDANYGIDDIIYRRCVNPDHLFLGTSGDNHRDMYEKGRGNTGERNGNNAGISDDVVRDVRRRRAAGESRLGLAREVGVNKNTITDWCGGTRRGAVK